MEERGWPPEDLSQYTDDLRKLIEADRKCYIEFKNFLYPAHPEIWDLVGELLKTRSRYYSAEIIRARRDTQRFALGENPVRPSRFGEMMCKEINYWLNGIPQKLDDIDDSYELYKSYEDKDAVKCKVAKGLWDIDEGLLRLTMVQLTKLTVILKRITYGG